MNVLGFVDFPGAVLSGASLFGGLFENPGKRNVSAVGDFTWVYATDPPNIKP